MAVTHTRTANDYGAPAAGARSNKLLRPLLAANHVLHWISALIVMSIAAYFIHKFAHNTHLVYWVTLAAIDALLYIPVLVLPFVKTYKGYAAPLAWIFSYLWLTAFIFAAQDYANGRCAFNSPYSIFNNHCTLKKTLAAFSFLAFFTNLIGTYLESRLWYASRHVTRTFDADKHQTAAPTATGAHPTGATV